MITFLGRKYRFVCTLNIITLNDPSEEILENAVRKLLVDFFLKLYLFKDLRKYIN